MTKIFLKINNLKKNFEHSSGSITIINNFSLKTVVNSLLNRPVKNSEFD